MIPLVFSSVAALHAQTAAARQDSSLQEQRQAAITAEQQGRLSDAEAAWQAVAKAHPADAEPYARLGLIAAHQEHYKDAAALYRKALTLDPKHPGLRLDLGLALFKDGQMKEAAVEFGKLVKATPPGSPQLERYEILLAMAHYGAAEYAEAVPLLKKAAADDPKNLPLRMTLAHSCLWSKQYQCVLDVYHEILTLNSESAEADMLAGEAIDGMHDRGGAIEQFRAAVKANPNEPNVHFGLGYLLWTQKHLEEAITEFQAELANDPKNIQSILYLGDAYLQLGQPDKARPLLEQAVHQDSSLWRAQFDLGILDSDAGQYEDALRYLQQAAKQQPDEVNIHMRLGRVYKSMGRTEEAKAEFAKANNITHAVDEDLIRKMNPQQKPAN